MLSYYAVLIVTYTFYKKFNEKFNFLFSSLSRFFPQYDLIFREST